MYALRRTRMRLLHIAADARRRRLRVRLQNGSWAGAHEKPRPKSTGLLAGKVLMLLISACILALSLSNRRHLYRLDGPKGRADALTRSTDYSRGVFGGKRPLLPFDRTETVTPTRLQRFASGWRRAPVAKRGASARDHRQAEKLGFPRGTGCVKTPVRASPPPPDSETRLERTSRRT